MQNPQNQEPVSTITYSANVMQVPPVPLGPKSAIMICPTCHNQISSSVESKPNSKTHLSALLLCCCICWPCAWLPYTMDSCQTQVHTCPQCKTYLGAYQN